jgi:hypothetical protein
MSDLKKQIFNEIFIGEKKINDFVKEYNLDHREVYNQIYLLRKKLQRLSARLTTVVLTSLITQPVMVQVKQKYVSVRHSRLQVLRERIYIFRVNVVYVSTEMSLTGPRRPSSPV